MTLSDSVITTEGAQEKFSAVSVCWREDVFWRHGRDVALNNLVESCQPLFNFIDAILPQLTVLCVYHYHILDYSKYFEIYCIVLSSVNRLLLVLPIYCY